MLLLFDKASTIWTQPYKLPSHNHNSLDNSPSFLLLMNIMDQDTSRCVDHALRIFKKNERRASKFSPMLPAESNTDFFLVEKETRI
jgi:hypothetical protein